MNKAEDRALEKYPKKIEWVGNQWDGAPFDVNSERRVAYKQGYEQAEKDLELSLEDIEIILNAFLDFKIESIKSKKTKKYTDKEYCVETLKRFKERKENAKVNV